MDKFMALDVGKTRIGVATGDPLGITVRPVGVVHHTSRSKDYARLVELIQETEATGPIKRPATGWLLKMELISL